jgi:peptidoglycan/LPS O-acetylase OafA/YrhL
LLQSIYITRFLAALCVVVYHYGLSVYPFETPRLHSWFSVGDEAVNYFFVLSGFILVQAYDNRLQSGEARRRFWVNRFSRIYPVYALGIILISLHHYFIAPGLFGSFGKRVIAEVFLLQSWAGITSLNSPGWSLSVEVFFYATFPFFLGWAKKRGFLRTLIFSVSVYVLMQLLIFTLYHGAGQNDRAVQFIRFFPLLHLQTFLVGVAAGIGYLVFVGTGRDRIATRLGVYFLTLCMGLVLLAAAPALPELRHDGYWAPFHALLIFSYCLATRDVKWLGNALFVYLGDISYALYILQAPVFLLFTKAAGQETRFSPVLFFSYVCILIVLSAVAYHFVEKPLQGLIRRNAAGA